MTLSESVAKLATLIPALKAHDAQFASDLIVSFKKYGSLTPKQAPWIERLIARAETPAAAPVAVVNVGGFAGVLALFATAKAHLKFPKIRLSLNGTKIVLSLNGLKSKRPGHVSISGEGVYPNKAFYGSVSPEGVFTPFKSELPGLTALLTELSSNPARVAKDHGKLTGNCCFCNKVLGLGKEKRSVLVGFGPDCAEHYGLKAEWLAAADKAEAKASVAAIAEPVTAIAVPVAPLTLEGPWLGSANAPTLSASDWKEDGKPFTFAEELKPVVNTDELQAKQAYTTEPVTDGFVSESKVTCFFCEEQTAQYASLHGYHVCPTCVAQLQ